MPTKKANEKTKNSGKKPSAPTTMPMVFQSIEQLAQRLRKFQERTLRETKITPPQYFILGMLKEGGDCPLKDVAEALGYAPATVTGIVDTMESKGLVTRSPNPADRRSVKITITVNGTRLLNSTPRMEKTFGGCCCDALPPEELEELGRLLRKLSEGLSF